MGLTPPPYYKSWWGFQSHLLPFMESQEIYQFVNYNYPGDCFQAANSLPPDQDPGNHVQPFEVCPDDPNGHRIWFDYPGYGHHACTNYFGNMGTTFDGGDGILFCATTTNFSRIKDGTSKTLLMGERGMPDDLYYGWPYCGCGNLTYLNGNGDNLLTTQLGLSSGKPDGNHDYHYWSYHAGIAMFIMADGSGHALSYEIDNNILKGLSTRAGDEVVSVP